MFLKLIVILILKFVNKWDDYTTEYISFRELWTKEDLQPAIDKFIQQAKEEEKKRKLEKEKKQLELLMRSKENEINKFKQFVNEYPELAKSIIEECD